jgi:predicted RNase H-like HicB family nuclease
MWESHSLSEALVLMGTRERAECWDSQRKDRAMARAFDVVIERDEDGYYVASVPQLPGCHTQAKSLDTLMKRIREAIDLCLEVEGDDLTPAEFVGVQRVLVGA